MSGGSSVCTSGTLPPLPSLLTSRCVTQPRTVRSATHNVLSQTYLQGIVDGTAWPWAETAKSDDEMHALILIRRMKVRLRGRTV